MKAELERVATSTGGLSWPLRSSVDETIERLASFARAHHWRLVLADGRFSIFEWSARSEKNRLVSGRIVADGSASAISAEVGSLAAKAVPMAAVAVVLLVGSLWRLFAPDDRGSVIPTALMALGLFVPLCAGILAWNSLERRAALVGLAEAMADLRRLGDGEGPYR